MELVKISHYEDQARLITESYYPEEVKKQMMLVIAPKFINLSLEEKITFITDEFEKALVRIGSVKDDSLRKGFMIAEIIEILCESPHLSIDEVKHIFRHGSLGLYGRNFGINPKSVNDWVIAYLQNDKRQIIDKLNAMAKMNNVEPVLTKEEQSEIIKKLTIEIFDERKEKGLTGIELLSYPIFNFLKLGGFIELTDLERKFLLEEAEEMLQSIHSNKREANIMQLSIAQMAKVLYVRDFFNELIEDGKDIRDIIK